MEEPTVDTGKIPIDVEIQGIYSSYCQLATIIHDYAVGKQLYQNKCYSWAITANYYSLMHCGRFICHLGLNTFPWSHRDLHRFLSGNGRFNGNTFNDLLGNFQQFTNVHDIEGKIRRLGQKLEKIKKLREDNSYEFFISSHQINHSVLNIQFPRVYGEIRNLNEEYLKFVLELFVAYINSLDYRDYFIAFLKDVNENYTWAFKNLIRDMKTQKIDEAIIQKISLLIEESLMSTLYTAVSLDDSFFDPIKYHSFTDKNKKMKQFIERIDVLCGDSCDEG